MKKIKFVLVIIAASFAIYFMSGCKKSVRGCTDPNSINYNPSAVVNDGSCIPKVYGCTDPSATNYNPAANVSDGSCVYTTKITVWTSLSTFPCSTAGINVYIDDVYEGYLSQYYNSAPSCGASGTVSADVTPGSHKFFAQCASGTTVWGPYYYNVSGSCYRWQLY
jgi:hypothetical protein